MKQEPDSRERRLINEIDTDLEQLLNEAYDTAPPSSLYSRLDRMITQEWGQSPGLVPSHQSILQRSYSALNRRHPILRIAACVVLLAAMIIVVDRGSPAYAWSSMIRAIEQRGISQLTGPDTERWLSLSEGLLGERSGSSLTLIDVRQHVALNRRTDERQVHRRKLSRGWKGAARDQLVLAFLLGNVDSELDIEQLEGARLVAEKWEPVTTGDEKQIALQVSWETKSGKSIDLRLTLDPATKLPIACEIPSASPSAAQSLTWSYPAVSVPERRGIDFSAEYPVVDVDQPASLLASALEPKSIEPTDSVREPSDSVPAESSSSSDEKRQVASNPTLTAEPVFPWKPARVITSTVKDMVGQIDSILGTLWQSKQIDPAPPADEEELLRRVFLDLCGRTPSIHEIRTYLANKSPDRYEQLVERLLRNRDHAWHLATMWRSFLIPEGIDLTAFGGTAGFDRWLAERFGKNDPYDDVVRSLLLAEGRVSRPGPLLFYSAAKLDPEILAARTARVFLGLRLECAQCHDHPFEPWSQEDFWSLAAYFARISRPRGELNKVSRVMQVHDVDHGEVKIPKSDVIVSPRFLSGEDLVEASSRPDATPARGSTAESRRQQLAGWMTDARNPYFSRATANRVWSMMFGKGIVDPVDDFGVRHPPTSPELLDLLAGRLISTKFDLQDLFRTIAMSRAYRLSSGAPTANPDRLTLFAQMNVKTFSAEQVYNCLTVATMLDSKGGGAAFSLSVTRPDDPKREEFLRQFGTSAGQSTEYRGGIPQALTLMNGTLIDSATGLSKSGLLKSLEAPVFTNRQRVELLFLASLSRYPRPSEWELLDQYVTEQTSGTVLQENLSDILWALLNGPEFTMNH